MNKNTLSVSVIGIGNMAQTIHLPMIKSFEGRFELKTIIDTHLPEAELERVSRRFNCSWSRDIEAAETDVAIIVTPISTHFPIARKLLNKNGNVLIEKALTDSVANLENLIDYKNTFLDKRCFCAHMRRFYKNINIAQTVFSSGLLGEISKIKIFEGNLYGWNRKFFSKERDNSVRNIDEGVLFDVGSHGIDAVAYILDAALLDFEIVSSTVDNGHLMSDIYFKGNASLTNQSTKIEIEGSFSNTTALSNMIWIVGEKATLMVSPNDSVKPKLRVRGANQLIETDINWHVVNPFYSMYDTIHNAISSKRESILDIENFMNTTDILEKAFIQSIPGNINWL